MTIDAVRRADMRPPGSTTSSGCVPSTGDKHCPPFHPPVMFGGGSWGGMTTDPYLNAQFANVNYVQNQLGWAFGGPGMYGPGAAQFGAPFGGVYPDNRGGYSYPYRNGFFVDSIEAGEAFAGFYRTAVPLGGGAIAGAVLGGIFSAGNPIGIAAGAAIGGAIAGYLGWNQKPYRMGYVPGQYPPGYFSGFYP